MTDRKYGPKQDFAFFKNKYAKTERHPSEVGTIELEREFLKAVVERAKTGVMPKLKAAMWDRTSKAGMPYRFVQLEVAPLDDAAEAPPEPKVEDDSGDDMPW